MVPVEGSCWIGVCAVFQAIRFDGSDDVGALPNITGSFSWDKHMFIGVSTAREAFSSATTIGTGYTYSAYEAGDKREVSFSASNSNDAYGKSTVVQPASLSLLACIKF